MDGTDFDLARRWADGDRASGAVLFERYYPLVVRFFRNKVAESAQDDLVQQTFLRCTRIRADLPEVTSFRAYLLRVAYTALVDHHREEGRGMRRLQTPIAEHFEGEEPALGSVDPLGRSPERAAARREEDRVLLKALRKLPFKYQVVLELHYWDELSASDISSVIDVPAGTVKTRLRKGRELLREAMQNVVTSPEARQSTLDDLEAWARRVGVEARQASESRLVPSSG